MTIFGTHLIAGTFTGNTEPGFQALDVALNQALPEQFAEASEAEVERAISRAHEAFASYSRLPASRRAAFLRTIADNIVALGDELIERACRESALPAPRILGERGRTVMQLQLFAEQLERGEYTAVIEPAEPLRKPAAKSDIRLGYLALGPVVVFGASNFPLAFSTAGGDTASALAAGCPVVMKAHDAHPGTSELVAQAILAAIEQCGIDAGVFSLLQGKNYAIASQLVTHPLIKAVAFTGSERVGMILQRQIFERPEPIPFYGELGSTNPQFLLPGQVAEQGASLAQQLVSSLMMGNGQFCTSPGVWLLQHNSDTAAFIGAACEALSQQPAGVMLTPAIAAGYHQAVAEWQHIEGVELLAQGHAGASCCCQPALFSCDLATYVANPLLQQEVFGSCALILRCRDLTEMQQFITMMRGSLTASIHAADRDINDSRQLLQTLIHKVGRIIYNEMPTGVEVCAAMNHGGPFPASTDVRTTSVGVAAMARFQRPICYQNMPQALLPELLRDR